MNNLKQTFLLLFFLWIFSCAPPSALFKNTGSPSKIKKINKLIVDSGLNATISIKAIDLQSNRTIYSINSDKLLMPASNNKLFIGAAALHYLGPDYFFKTKVVKQNNNIVLVAGANPDLSVQQIDSLAHMVAKNIGTIDTLFLDATIHDSINYGKGWMWDEGSWWYAAPVSALSLNDNCIDFYVSPGKIDEPAMISTFPETDYVNIINRSRTVNDTINKKKFRIERNWINQTNIFTISGEILDTSSVDTFRRNIFDPVLFTGTVFANYLRKYGAVVQTLKKGKAKPTDILISEHYSDSLIFSMKNIMYESDNLSTELLSKSIGMNDTIPGNWSLGLKKVRIFLSDSVHIDTSKIYIADGSGVSRYNLASTDQFVELLSYMYRSSFAKDFLFTLPSGGSQGSLENRFLVMGKSIKAKTGHLSGVSNLSGYLFPPKNDPIGFSILINGFVGSAKPYHKLQEKILWALFND